MKTKPEVVTYEIVAQKINELSSAGEKISVRSILALTGGSSTKIAEFLKRWHENQQIMHEYGGISGMSEEFATACAREKKLIIKTATEAKSKELANLTGLFNELTTISLDQEKKLKANAEINQELKNCQEEIKGLERELRRVHNSCDVATTKLGAILQKSEDAKKACDLAEQKQKILENEVRVLSDEKSSWKAKAEQAQEQLKELYKKLKLANK